MPEEEKEKVETVVDEDEFVDVESEKLAAEREAKKAEEAKKAAEKKEAEEAGKVVETETGPIDTSDLHLPAELQGDAVPRVITVDEKGAYEYDNPKLSAMEEARKAWKKSYRLSSILKVGISTFCLLLIVLAWVIPTTVMGSSAGSVPLYIALGTAAGSLVIMALTSFLVKKKQNRFVSTYFHAFYKPMDEYLFEGLDIANVQGDVDTKLSQEEFDGGKAFKKTHNVGSRDSLTFTYKGVDAAVSDAASQEEGKNRALMVTFVGKFLRMHNNLKLDNGVIFYFKGNDRAIPPTGIIGATPAIKNDYYNVYGLGKDIAKIPSETMMLIEKIRTNKLLVDVTISIQSGRTYMYLGVEDTLMILPNKDQFNPNYLIAYKQIFASFLEIGYSLSGEKDKQ